MSMRVGDRSERPDRLHELLGRGDFFSQPASRATRPTPLAHPPPA